LLKGAGIFHSFASVAHRVPCKKEAGINWMPACVTELVEAVCFESIVQPLDIP
jgi:hypothetical protein